MKFDPERVARALHKSWSLATARQWTAENPAAGQCNVTALLVHELFGGELLKTRLPEGDHFYNRVDGQRYDFTESQFTTQFTIQTCQRLAQKQSAVQHMSNLRQSRQHSSGTAVLPLRVNGGRSRAAPSKSCPLLPSFPTPARRPPLRPALH